MEDNKSEIKLQVTKSRVYEIAIVSTMSSGKSTLINALIGKTLLPSRNQACTNCITSVLDNDSAQDVSVHILRTDGSYSRLADCDAQMISDMLQSGGEVSDVLIECDIHGIRNIKKSVLMVDTPGVNNADDVRHAEITHSYLRSIESGSIVYVLNAAAIGTSDDASFLSSVRDIMRSKPDLQIVFVLNKADMFDPEKEPLDAVVSSCAQYLQANGFDDPTILPVSSAAALLFKKAIAGDRLTRREMTAFLTHYEMFRPEDMRLSAFARRAQDEDRAQVREIGGQTFVLRDLYSALENTGFPLLEDVLEMQMTEQLRSRAPRVHGAAKKAKSDTQSKQTKEKTPLSETAQAAALFGARVAGILMKKTEKEN